MWLVGSSCLCKLMTSLFSVVSFYRFVLLAHWSPCTHPLNPPSSSPSPNPFASSLLINMMAEGIHSDQKCASFINRWLWEKNKTWVGRCASSWKEMLLVIVIRVIVLFVLFGYCAIDWLHFQETWCINVAWTKVKSIEFWSGSEQWMTQMKFHFH